MPIPLEASPSIRRAALFVRPGVFLLGGLLLCVLSFPAAVAVGSLSLPPGDLLHFFLYGGDAVVATAPGGFAVELDAATLRAVILDIRLPRVALALLAGAGLALAGVIFQSILRNPLADPFTLGVSSGAAFGAALAISLGLSGLAMGTGVPLFAFAGAVLALFAVLALSRGGKGSVETLVLAGVVVSAFLSALITLVKAIDEDSVTGIVFWIMGSFQGRGWTDLALFLPGAVLGGGVAFLLHRQLDILSLGDKDARHLGLSAGKTRLLLLVAASGITASCVAVAGIIGFVGLIVPHVCRLMLGSSARRLLPASALFGAVLLVWSDAAARSVLSGGVELPVGVITALFGGPFFCFLLARRGVKGKTPLFGGQEAVPPAESMTDDARPETAAPAAPSATSPLRRSLSPFGPVAPLAQGSPDTAKDLDTAELKSPHPVVTLDKVTVIYPLTRCPALDRVSLAIRKGEMVGLLGENGSGKSTLLHCLSGIIKPVTGESRVDGLPMDALPERKRARSLALLPQHPERVPGITAFSLALMGRYSLTSPLAGYSEKDREATATALALTGALHLARRQADTLSGGELQRVLLARALAQETPLLLLDEATAGLDPACQTFVLDAVARRNCRTGLTVFAALHDLNLAALYCSRLIFLKNGRIIADGPVREVFTAEVLFAVYGMKTRIIVHPDTGCPQALPLSSMERFCAPPLSEVPFMVSPETSPDMPRSSRSAQEGPA